MLKLRAVLARSRRDLFLNVYIIRVDGFHEPALLLLSTVFHCLPALTLSSLRFLRNVSKRALSSHLLSSPLSDLPHPHLVIYRSIELQCGQLSPRGTALKCPYRPVLFFLPLHRTSIHRYPSRFRNIRLLGVGSSHFECVRMFDLLRKLSPKSQFLSVSPFLSN